MIKNKKYSHGFALIELLVVVLIIGILAAVALPQYKKVVVKTKYATLKNYTKAFYQSQKNYYLANNEVYAKTFDKLDIGQSSTNNQVIRENAYCCIEETYLYCIDQKIKLSYVIQYNGKTYCVPYDDKLSPIVCKEETHREAQSNGWYKY